MKCSRKYFRFVTMLSAAFTRFLKPRRSDEDWRALFDTLYEDEKD